jgi:hypothetical protein
MSYYPPPQHQAPPPQEKNNTAMVGFIMSIVSLFTCGLLSPISLGISIAGMRREPRTFAIIGLAISILSMVMVLPAAGIMVAIAVPSFMRAREISRRNACQENLSKIDGAKQQWALENNVQEDAAAPTWDDIVGSDKYLRMIPVCPSQGTYTVNPLTENPSCSMSTQQPFAHVFPGAWGGNGSYSFTSDQAVEVIGNSTDCSSNLVRIDAAKQQWALETNASDDAIPTWQDLVGVDKYLRETPVCPSGGTYSINSVALYPGCTFSTQEAFPHKHYEQE